MSSDKSKTPEAPECVHDEMEAYYVTGSPNAEAFAPGMEDLHDSPLVDVTPWRKRGGWIADLARRRRPDRADAGGTATEVVQPPVHERSNKKDDTDERAADELENIALSGLRVLVVHPDLDTRKQVAAVIAQMGVKVSSCGQVEQAVLQVLHERPDAVITEIDTPGFDAIALCRSLHDRVPEIPVLLVANDDDAASYSVAMENGAADYLRRPVDPQFVGERLRLAVARARSKRRRRMPYVDAPVGPDAKRGAHPLSRELRRQELKIQSLFELSKNVVGCVELEELYQGFLLTAMGQLGFAAGVLYHLDASTSGKPLEIVARGVARSTAKRLVDFRSGLGAYLLRAAQPLLLESEVFPKEMIHQVTELRHAGFEVACPMAAKGTPVGVALFGSRVSGSPFSVDDLVMLTAVCNFAGPALEGARLYTELHQTYLSTVRAFVSSLEAKDTYTRGHSERVADYARVVGESMGLAKHDIDMLVFGAVLHDIGKIGVAEGILNKPGPLTPEEWRVVREHPEMGARIVGNIDYLEPSVGLILHHHERIDGRGYPHGLAGSDIELGARIVTIVDSFDAMTTDRPYRKGMDLEQAVRLLRANAGRQFDPQLVDRFVGLLENGSIELKI